MKDPIEFPALGATGTVCLPEPFAQVEIDFRLVSPRTYRKWARWIARNHSAEKRRLAAERKVADKGDPCHDDGYATDEGDDELQAVGEVILGECMTAVRGLRAGDVDLGTVTDPKKLLELMSWCDMTGAAGLFVFQGQSPSPKVATNSESPSLTTVSAA